MNGKSLLAPVQHRLIDYIFNHVSDRVFILDDKKNFIKVNAPAEILLKQAGDVKNLKDLYYKLKITDFEHSNKYLNEDPIDHVLEGKAVTNLEICIHLNEDDRVYYHLDALPFQEEESEKFVILILKDVTDYLKLNILKNEFQKKAAELENIINTISDGVAIVDSTGNYTLLDPACNDIFEYPIHKLLAGESIKKEIYKVEINEKIKFITVSGIPVFDPKGNLEYAVICYNDVTELQRQKNMYAQQKQLIGNLFDGLGAPIAAVSYPQCRFTLVNEEYTRFVEELAGRKYSAEELKGKTFSQALPKPVAESFYRDVINMVQGKMAEEKIIVYKDANGDDRHFRVVYSLILDEKNEIEYVTAIGVEVTEEVKARAEVEALAKMKEEYFAVISHELRSPIAVVHAATQMLTSDLYEGEFSGNTKKMLSRIEKNTYRLLGLVNNFLDITKIEAGFMEINYSKAEIGNLTETLLESLQPAAQKKSIQLEMDNICESKFINIDVEKYERILLNLLTNALKFTETKGTVSLKLMEDENNIIVKIQDDGIGIPKDKQDKIFDRFFIIDSSMSRKNCGSGIGLSLVKKLVEVMKGTITVDSQEGQGSLFMLKIPKNNG